MFGTPVQILSLMFQPLFFPLPWVNVTRDEMNQYRDGTMRWRDSVGIEIIINH